MICTSTQLRAHSFPRIRAAEWEPFTLSKRRTFDRHGLDASCLYTSRTYDCHFVGCFAVPRHFYHPEAPPYLDLGLSLLREIPHLSRFNHTRSTLLFLSI